MATTSKELLRELLNTIKTELDEDDITQVEGQPVPDTSEANRILDMDRSPVHSGIQVTENDSVTVEYGSNAAIKAHANRWKFGAKSKINARLARKALETRS